MEGDDQLIAKLRRLMELRESFAAAKAEKTRAEREFREYEAELQEDMEESSVEGSRKVNLGPPYGTVVFTPRGTTYGRAIDKAALREWAEEQGLADEIFSDPKVSDRKLNEIAREATDAAEGLPPGMDSHTRKFIQVTVRG